MNTEDPEKSIRMRLQRDGRPGRFRWTNPHSRPIWWEGTWTPDDGSAPVVVGESNSGDFIRDDTA